MKKGFGVFLFFHYLLEKLFLYRRVGEEEKEEEENIEISRRTKKKKGVVPAQRKEGGNIRGKESFQSKLREKRPSI